MKTVVRHWLRQRTTKIMREDGEEKKVWEFQRVGKNRRRKLRKVGLNETKENINSLILCQKIRVLNFRTKVEYINIKREVEKVSKKGSN